MVDVNAFWFGPRLGAVHAACLRSFVRHGYTVRLHVYEPPADLPEGVELFDAEQLMKRSELVSHGKTGSYALASDKYRYRILRAGLGVYVDADVYCLKPLPERNFLIGWENDKAVNGAVLAAPSDSRLVAYLNDVFLDRSFIPPWERKSRRHKLMLKKAIGLAADPASMPWGTYGPALITHAVKSFGLEAEILPIDTFYPLHFSQLSLLYDADLTLADITTQRTCAVHLYNFLLPDRAIPETSPLGRMLSGKA